MSNVVYWVDIDTGSNTSSVSSIQGYGAEQVRGIGDDRLIAWTTDESFLLGPGSSVYGSVLHHAFLWLDPFTMNSTELESRSASPAKSLLSKQLKYLPAGNRWGIKCGSLTNPTYFAAINAWDTVPSSPSHAVISGGPEGSVAPIVTREPITVMFLEDGSPVEAHQFSFTYYNSGLLSCSIDILGELGNTVATVSAILLSDHTWTGCNTNIDQSAATRYITRYGDSSVYYSNFVVPGPAYGFRLNYESGEQEFMALGSVEFATLAPEPPEETYNIVIPASDITDSGTYSDQFYGTVTWDIPDLTQFEKGLVDVFVELEGAWSMPASDNLDAVCYINGRSLDFTAVTGSTDTTPPFFTDPDASPVCDTTGTFKARSKMDLYSGCSVTVPAIVGGVVDRGSATWTVTSAKYILVIAEGVDVSGPDKWKYVSDEEVNTDGVDF